MKTKPFLLRFVTLLLCMSPPAHAATRTWDGSASGFWTNAANWSGGIAPTNGDSLVFPVGVARVAMTNSSGAPSNFMRLEFSGSNYVVFGPALTLTNGITNSVNNFSSNTLNCPVRLGADQTWTNTSRATLVVNGNLNLNSHTLTFGSLGRFEINGALTNSGSAVKVGNGDLNFNGTNTFTGAVTLTSGPLRVDGALTAASLVLNSGALEGNGSVHGFTANTNTTVAPGDITTPGQLVSTAGVSFKAGATFDVDLNGTVAGTGYDQLAVTGTVDLGGAALVRVLGFVPSLGDRFVIIDNDGTDPVTNTFANLPEGALLTNGTTVLQITYTGGSGNDVELFVRDFAPRIWSGLGTNASWSNNSNWVGNLAPFVHDQLVFPAGAARPTNVNDFAAGSAFDSITLSDSNYFITGNSISLNAGITNGPDLATNTFNCALELGLTNSTLSVATNSVLVLAGALTGSGGLVKSGPGTLTLSGSSDNSYTGGTFVNEGTLLLGKTPGTDAIPGALTIGDGVGGGGADVVTEIASDQIPDSAPITLNSSGRLNLNGQSDTLGPFTLTGGGIETGAGTLFMNGDVIVDGGLFNSFISGKLDVGAATRTFNLTNSSDLIIGASISGSGGLIKNGDGQLTLSSSNSFTGTLTMNSGTLKIQSSAALGTTNGGTVVQGNANIFLLSNVGPEPLTLNSTGDPTISAGAVLFLPSSAGISNSWAGNIALGQDSAIDVGGGSALGLGGVISGAGALIKIGTGKITLSGHNAYSGETRVNAGTLLVNGAQPVSPVIVNGATLGGIGTVGTIVVTNGGSIAPGASPGILSSSNVTFSPSTFFTVQLNGTSAGTAYDQLSVSGSVNLAGSALNASLGFVPAISNAFVIINNDGSDPVTNTFNNLPNGAIFSLGGFTFQIAYNGGSGGNDVVLMRVSVPPSQISSITSLANGFKQIQGLGLSNVTYYIQANTNLNTTNWTLIGLAAATNGGGVFSFTDTSAPSFPQRFYRALSP